MNRLLGIECLKGSSDGETLVNILREKLLPPDDVWNSDVGRNFIGFSHDRGSAICGDDEGMRGLLRAEVP